MRDVDKPCTLPGMKRTKLSPAEVVIHHFGAAKLGRILGLSRSTPINWRKRHGLVPSEYHRKILDAGKGKITPDDLIYGR